MKSSVATTGQSGGSCGSKGGAEGEILKEKLRLLEAKQKELRKKVNRTYGSVNFGISQWSRRLSMPSCWFRRRRLVEK